MGDVYVSRAKQAQLAERMVGLEIHEADLVERFVLGSGSGGQKLNKTASCVYLKHTPSGVEVKCQRSRSQAMNRFLARVELCETIIEQRAVEKSRRQQEAERIRRQKRRRSRRQKQRMLEAKHRQGDKKRLRQAPQADTDG